MTNENLVKELISGGYLKTPLIINAFKKIDRKDFILSELSDDAYGNYPLPIGFGQTISQPLTVAFMLELLEPKPEEKILDVGSGSGWQTAMLAYIVSGKKNYESRIKSNGKVIAIERIPELKKMTETNISKYNFISKNIVEVVLGDGSAGYPKEAPFDKIIAAAAGEELPAAWKEQLKIGGKIVAPVRQSIFVFDKISDNEFQKKEYFGFSFVPLVKS